ncbi:MAG: hypothetical protein PVJ84_16130, partial [Desulfobacteraceae bacterium]
KDWFASGGVSWRPFPFEAFRFESVLQPHKRAKAVETRMTLFIIIKSISSVRVNLLHYHYRHCDDEVEQVTS